MDKPELTWDQEVEVLLQKVKRQANVYLFLGYGVYGLGSVAIMYFMRNQPGLATATVMFLFQLCVMYFGTKVIFPCIGGGYHVGLLANRKSMPAFATIAKVMSDPENSPLIKELRQAALDIRTTGDTIRNEIAGLRESMTKPIVAPFRKIVAPPTEVVPSAEPAKVNGT